MKTRVEFNSELYQFQEDKNKLRNDINADIENFLANGGKIEVIPFGVEREPVKIKRLGVRYSEKSTKPTE